MALHSSGRSKPCLPLPFLSTAKAGAIPLTQSGGSISISQNLLRNKRPLPEGEDKDSALSNYGIPPDHGWCSLQGALSISENPEVAWSWELQPCFPGPEPVVEEKTRKQAAIEGVYNRKVSIPQVRPPLDSQGITISLGGKRKGSRTEGMMTTERQPEDLRQGLDAEAEQSSHLWCLAPPDSAHQHQDLRWCSRVRGCHGLDCTCLNVIRWSLNLYLEISPLKR